jgi:hypothetical protein
MIIKGITFAGKPVVVGCDAKCNKAWGRNSRPQKHFDEADDFAYLPDGDLGEAPIDPGTYEGGHAKPTSLKQAPNKWCVRECERCAMTNVIPKQMGELKLPDFSKPVYNIPNKHTNEI